MVFFMVNNLRREVNARFVEIGGIVDHHCLLCVIQENNLSEITVFYCTVKIKQEVNISNTNL
jgi:hypothetical protein